MKKILYIIGLTISFLAIPFFYFMVINTGVSLKYETEYGECISYNTGIDLCKQQELFLNLTYLSGFVFLGLIGLFVYKGIKANR